MGPIMGIMTDWDITAAGRERMSRLMMMMGLSAAAAGLVLGTRRDEIRTRPGTSRLVQTKRSSRSSLDRRPGRVPGPEVHVSGGEGSVSGEWLFNSMPLYISRARTANSQSS
jgi:hypothetical protein